MDTLFNASLVLLTILYTLLIMAYARIFTRSAGGLALYVGPLLVGTVSLHFASILVRSISIGACPLGSRAEFMALVAFSVSLTYLFLEVRIGERSTGIFAMTPAFVLQVIATVSILSAPSSLEAPGESLDALESLHSLAGIVGFSAVALSNVYSLLYLSLYAAIKRGRFGLFYRKMPPLETLSDLNVVATAVAFVALSAMVGTGFWKSFQTEAGTVPANPEVILTALLWLLFGGCIVARRFLRLGGKRFAYTTLLGLFLLVGIFVGGFFAQGFHG